MTDSRRDIHVLIVLGRVGRYWGDKNAVLEQRGKALAKALSSPGSYGPYTQAILTGGPEIHSARSNANQLSTHVFWAGRGARGTEVEIQDESCSNRIALIRAIDSARQQWPDDNIFFDVITSEFAVPRMVTYFDEHIQQLIELHAGKLSPRMLHRRFIAAESKKGQAISLRSRLREWLKCKLDVKWRSYPVEPVQIPR